MITPEKPHYMVSSNGRMFEKLKLSMDTAPGRYEVRADSDSEGVYQWTLKIEKLVEWPDSDDSDEDPRDIEEANLWLARYSNMFIGIDTSYNERRCPFGIDDSQSSDDDDDAKDNAHSYALGDNGKLQATHLPSSDCAVQPAWNEGDSVEMTLDVGKGELSYAVNGQSLGVLFRNIHKGRNNKYQVFRYKLAVWALCRGSKIRIISFSSPNYADNDEDEKMQSVE